MIDSDTILTIIAKEAAIDRTRLAPAATLDDLAITSLDVVSILFSIEDTCGVEFDPAEFEGVRTVQDFVSVVIAKANSPAAGASAP